MGWFSDLFGGHSAKDDWNTFYAGWLADQQKAASDKAIQDQKDADTKAATATQRTNSINSAKNNANSYFTSLGLDPSQFQGDIDQKINDAIAQSPEDDPNIGQYLGDLGKTIYDSRENALRTKAGRDVNLAFGPDYANTRITNTLEDPIVSQINNEQRGSADDYITNLFKRGVISDSGKAAAEKNLDTQGSRVRSILDELGNSALSTGRQTLDDIANRGRSAASTLTLGNNFDPSTYTSEADQAYNDFTGKLGDSIRAQAPTNLYDTSKLASIAGGAQGAGNFKFDPNALAGLPSQDDQSQEDPNKRITF